MKDKTDQDEWLLIIIGNGELLLDCVYAEMPVLDSREALEEKVSVILDSFKRGFRMNSVSGCVISTKAERAILDVNR